MSAANPGKLNVHWSPTWVAAVNGNFLGCAFFGVTTMNMSTPGGGLTAQTMLFVSVTAHVAGSEGNLQSRAPILGSTGAAAYCGSPYWTATQSPGRRIVSPRSRTVIVLFLAASDVKCT